MKFTWESWLSWPLWNFMAAIATVLSLIAIVIAVVEFVRNRRVLDRPVWMTDRWATRDMPAEKGNGRRVDYMVDLINVGTRPGRVALIKTMHAKLHIRDDARVHWARGPGEKMQLQFVTETPEEAWASAMFVSPMDPRWVTVEWFPIHLSGETHDLWRETLIPKRKRFRLRTRRKTVPVVPGGALSTDIPRTLSKEKRDAAIAIAFSLAPDGEGHLTTPN